VTASWISHRSSGSSVPREALIPPAAQMVRVAMVMLAKHQTGDAILGELYSHKESTGARPDMRTSVTIS
jgi:hypothetical protein